MIDVTHHLNEVRRAVGSRVLEAGEARVVTLRRTYEGSLDDVWDACTNPERLPRWFLPVSGDLQEGGHYQLEGNASGTIERCDPPQSFAATWEFGGQVSWIEVRLSQIAPERVLLKLEHIGAVDEDRWAQFGPGAAGVGWDLTLVGLARHLTGGPPLTPATFAVWLGSEEGRRFLRLSNELWLQASLTAGTAEADARLAAGRNFAFYTGSSGRKR